MSNYDFAVVGAGVAGLSVAAALSEQASVVLIERESQPAYHSSGRSAAVYIEGYESHVVAGLTRASRDFFFQQPGKFSEHPLLHPLGGLTVGGADQLAAFDDHLATWQPGNPELHEISVSEAVEKLPVLNPDWIKRVSFDPSMQGIDVHELLSGFRRQFIQRGGKLVLGQAVTGLNRTDSGWLLNTSALTTDQSSEQDISARWVVNAAGSWCEELAALAGLAPVGLTPLRRTAVLCSVPESARHWPMVHDCENTVYFKPDAGALMVSPADEHPSVPCDAQPEDIDVAIALDRFQQITTMQVKRVAHRWAGLRTFAPDRNPVLGFDPLAPNFYWLGGQGGFGVQTSPAISRLAANDLLALAPIPDPQRAQLHVRRYR